MSRSLNCSWHTGATIRGRCQGNGLNYRWQAQLSWLYRDGLGAGSRPELEGWGQRGPLSVVAGVTAGAVLAGRLLPLGRRGDPVGVPAGVVPADVVVGVRVERRLVAAGLAFVEQLAEVRLHQRPVDVVLLVAVGGVDHDALDARRPGQGGGNPQLGPGVPGAGAPPHGPGGAG